MSWLDGGLTGDEDTSIFDGGITRDEDTSVVGGGLTGDPDSNVTDPDVSVVSPSLFFESATFGLVDRDEIENAGVPTNVSFNDLRDETSGGNGGGVSQLRLASYAFGLAVLAYTVGQLFTIELGS